MDCAPSHLETDCRVTDSFSASSSCDQPSFLRSSMILSAKIIRMLLLFGQRLPRASDAVMIPPGTVAYQKDDCQICQPAVAFTRFAALWSVLRPLAGPPAGQTVRRTVSAAPPVSAAPKRPAGVPCAHPAPADKKAQSVPSGGRVCPAPIGFELFISSTPHRPPRRRPPSRLPWDCCPCR